METLVFRGNYLASNFKYLSRAKNRAKYQNMFTRVFGENLYCCFISTHLWRKCSQKLFNVVWLAENFEPLALKHLLCLIIHFSYINCFLDVCFLLKFTEISKEFYQNTKPFVLTLPSNWILCWHVKWGSERETAFHWIYIRTRSVIISCFSVSISLNKTTSHAQWIGKENGNVSRV